MPASLVTGTVPAEWKQANVTLVHKKGTYSTIARLSSAKKVELQLT